MRSFAKGIELLPFVRIEFDVLFKDRMLLIHNEEQNRPLQPHRFVELEFRNQLLIGIAIWVDRRLSVFSPDNQGICDRISHHLQRRTDDVGFGTRAVIRP
jgi:hypothetical protein